MGSKDINLGILKLTAGQTSSCLEGTKKFKQKKATMLIDVTVVLLWIEAILRSSPIQFSKMKTQNDFFLF